MGGNPETLTNAAGVVVFEGTTSEGGGSQPGAAIVRGPFSFAFNTPNLAAGIATGYTPAAGDVLIDAFYVIRTAFDGTTPRADFGANAGGGIFNSFASVVALDDTADAPFAGLIYTTNAFHSLRDAIVSDAAANTKVMNYRASWLFETAAPLLLWASQGGAQGGTALDSAAGAADLYIVTAALT